LVQNPQWTLEELYGYYRQKFSLSPAIRYASAPPKRSGMSLRDCFDLASLSLPGSVSSRLKGSYRRRRVIQESRLERPAGREIHHHLLGVAPGPDPCGVGGGPDEVGESEKKLEALLNEWVL
jgi:hypothetical protein